MQPDAAGSHSVVTNGNSFNTSLISLEYSDSVTQNHAMPSFLSPSTLGEAFNNFTRINRDPTRDFSPGPFYPQISHIQYSDQFSGPLACPFEYPKPTIATNSSNVVSSSLGPTNYGYEVFPFDTSAKWVPNEWVMMEQGGSSQFSNELSLSLATSQHGTSMHEQCSEMSSSSGGTTSYSLHKRHVVGPEHTSCSRNNDNLSLSFNSHKPLQVSSSLSGSRFLHAMQEILAEIACYALENFDQMSYSGGNAGRRISTVDFSDGLDDVDHQSMFQNNLHEREVEEKKKHLLALLQAVDDRYNQCLDEIHTVISAFHAVTELDPNVHARFALPTISFMYKNLRERISSHILAMGACINEGGETRDQEKSFETSFIQKQWALQQLRKRDHQLWRPQRGLPERSVSVLRAWMFQNFLHPYPKDAEKHLLALKSGLTRSQVSNWFINARVRLWKPMIEEMYAEMNRRKARRNDEETDGAQRNHLRFENRRFTMD
ncbi:hypothetical protein BUALT_Bualt10G0123300 [Buddleja alternifolia]|uniref:Homeobox domain-containing protein n=1 Tax=Buddleja alternifolia TaxID=168488 RepID=A0AAV6WY81_9LAMI|nr:hypothetical protein BUALT_Bualt10G0123300 [Buddleja alternifolia]